MDAKLLLDVLNFSIDALNLLAFLIFSTIFVFNSKNKTGK